MSDKIRKVAVGVVLLQLIGQKKGHVTIGLLCPVVWIVNFSSNSLKSNQLKNWT